MEQTLKEAWLKALRSGEFKQAFGKLHNGQGYCCLGVLCKVMGSEFTQLHDGRWQSDRAEMNVPCQARVQEAGLQSGQVDLLMGMNDRLGKTFGEIADWLEGQ